ncbi:hypothetical protein FOZ61_009252 [Perkinsus olseni]|uniref:MARVEL domain-containing protein n=1 Tax=Perkinsus olseni TaxID=32597 RepID=A0A7J6L7G2_PEROL|nr:hypothetical protein FOZ61_009252 [Perkinsus olseni]KAF4655111.1 hypothetical protein FOL46_008389 [Perkinsus olseni]
MSAVKEPEDDTKLNLTFKEKLRYAFEDPTPHSNTFMRVIGIVGAVAAFVSAIIAFISSIVEFSFMPLYRTPLNYCVIVFFIIFSALMLLIEILPGSMASKGVIEDANFLGNFFGRGWFYFVLGIFYVCSGHIICALVGIYLLIVAVIFVTMGAIRYAEERTAEEKEAKDQVIEV